MWGEVLVDNFADLAFTTSAVEDAKLSNHVNRLIVQINFGHQLL